MTTPAELRAPQGSTLVPCTHARHADQILAIFNDAIANSTALYDYKPRPREAMQGWFQAKEQGGFPVLGLENEGGELMAFASYGTFRAFPAFKYLVEHSVYVDGRFRGRGLGEAMMAILIERGPMTFVIGKYAMTAVGLPVLLLFQDHRMFRTGFRVRHLFPVFVGLYLVLLTYQVGLLRIASDAAGARSGLPSLAASGRT